MHDYELAEYLTNGEHHVPGYVWDDAEDVMAMYEAQASRYARVNLLRLPIEGLAASGIKVNAMWIFPT